MIENFKQELKCDCNLMWLMIQEMSIRCFCKLYGCNEGFIILVYSDCVCRIVVIYVCFYLEKEDYGDLVKKGCFYWMVLGVFVSKMVVCFLDDICVVMIDIVFKGLVKGNFWFFYDISGWYWYYMRFGMSFDLCISQWDVFVYIIVVKEQVMNYLWKDEVFFKINNMWIFDKIQVGFFLVKQIEEELDCVECCKLQWDYLIKIVEYE